MKNFFTRVVRLFVGMFAFAALLQLVVGFVGLPRFVTDPFTARGEKPPDAPPEIIIVLGGGGIPSESGLMRSYYAADLAKTNPASHVVISLPGDGDTATNAVGKMRREMVMRGVPAQRIRLESKALDTHEQAVNVAKLLGPAALTQNVRIVTGPWQAGRALGCFRKLGFENATTTAALNTDVEVDPGANAQLRYVFWANLTATVECAREACAVAVYKLRGWM